MGNTGNPDAIHVQLRGERGDVCCVCAESVKQVEVECAL